MQADVNDSFTGFLQRYGDRFPPSMRRRPEDDPGRWQEEFRRAVESLRSTLPERVPLRAQTLAVTQLPDHTRILLRYPVNAVVQAHAYLLLPAGLAAGERRPGIVVLHGHDQGGIDSICGVTPAATPVAAARAYGLWAVRAGYVVLSPAWWGWPGRNGHLEKVGQRDRCNVIQMAAHMYGIHVLDLHLQDGQAAVDVLCARPEVAAEHIGCIGNSYGGRTAMWLTVFEPRIRACVSSGAMNTFRERSLKLASCAIQTFPGLLRYGDVPEVYSLIAPRPLQLQAGAQDALLTAADRDHIERTVRDIYQRFGKSAYLDYVLHPGGHLLVWERAAPFLRQHLGGR